MPTDEDAKVIGDGGMELVDVDTLRALPEITGKLADALERGLFGDTYNTARIEEIDDIRDHLLQPVKQLLRDGRVPENFTDLADSKLFSSIVDIVREQYTESTWAATVFGGGGRQMTSEIHSAQFQEDLASILDQAIARSRGEEVMLFDAKGQQTEAMQMSAELRLVSRRSSQEITGMLFGSGKTMDKILQETIQGHLVDRGIDADKAAIIATGVIRSDRMSPDRDMLVSISKHAESFSKGLAARLCGDPKKINAMKPDDLKELASKTRQALRDVHASAIEQDTGRGR